MFLGRRTLADGAGAEVRVQVEERGAIATLMVRAKKTTDPHGVDVHTALRDHHLQQMDTGMEIQVMGQETGHTRNLLDFQGAQSVKTVILEIQGLHFKISHRLLFRRRRLFHSQSSIPTFRRLRSKICHLTDKTSTLEHGLHPPCQYLSMVKTNNNTALGPQTHPR